MPRYNYECKVCLKKALKKHELVGLDIAHGLPLDVFETEVLFETSHSMQPTENELHEAVECPRCGSHRCERSYYGSNIHSYAKGYGWLDKAGIRRDMNKYTLLNNDPYGQYRSPGEVDHIASSLEKQGRHDPKTKHYSPSSEKMEEAVKKAIDNR